MTVLNLVGTGENANKLRRRKLHSNLNIYINTSLLTNHIALFFMTIFVPVSESFKYTLYDTW